MAAEAVGTRLAVPPRSAAGGSPCPGCGAVLDDHPGPKHVYLGASPACWHLHGTLSGAVELGREGSRERQLARSAYAVQHPGVPSRRSIQSVAVHLMVLCVQLEPGDWTRPDAPQGSAVLRWLTPPPRRGRLTVVDVIGAAARGGSATVGIEAWARDVWKAWSEHHETVAGWLAARGPQLGDRPGDRRP